MTAFYNELEPFCCSVLRERIADGSLPPGDVLERDVRLVQPADIQGYDQIHLFAGIGGGGLACRLAGIPDDFPVFTAGVPCQPASVAGNRAGAADDRWLWPDALRLLRVVGQHYALFENPPGLSTLDGGREFGRILGQLADLGRDAEWSHVSAAEMGAAHRRNRIWLVAYPVGRGADVAHSAGGRHEQPSGLAEASSERAQRLAVSGAVNGCPDGSEGTLADSDCPRQQQSEGDVAVERGRDRDGGEARSGDGVSVAGRYGARAAEPAMGRTADELPTYMGGTQPPAPPGQAQHGWEEPRLVESLGPDGRKALAAFGNAWYPPAAVPALQRILHHHGVGAAGVR